MRLDTRMSLEQAVSALGLKAVMVVYIILNFWKDLLFVGFQIDAEGVILFIITKTAENRN